MNQVLQPTGLIRPFNLDPAECKSMYNSSLPEHLVMNLTLLLPWDQVNEEEPCAHKGVPDELARVVERCTLDAGNFNIPSKIVHSLDYREESTAEWWSMPKLQQQWLYDGVYVQVHFLNPDLIGGLFDPSCGICIGMMVYDRLVSKRGELDPSKQPSFLTTERLAENYQNLLGRMYAEGVGVWTQSLIEYRNMVMIKCRAVLAGQNPDTEYDRFVKTGGSYFLEYRRLCP